MKITYLLLFSLIILTHSLSQQCQHQTSLHPLSHTQTNSPTTRPNINITNLGAKNWIYGDLSTPQYQKIRFGIITKNNATNCPLNIPFVFKDSTLCEQCPIQTPIFNLQTELCEPCQQDKVFQFRTQLCVDKLLKVKPKIQNTTQIQPVLDVTSFKNITNIDAKNWILGDLSFTDYQLLRFSILEKYNTTNCPLKTPFVLQDSKECTSCPEQSPIFVLSTSSCMPCQTNTVFNKTSGKCEVVDCKNKQLQNSITEYYNKFQLCQANQYYDYEKDKCASCQPGQFFDQDWLSCMYCEEDKPFLNQDFECKECPEDTEIDRINNICT